MSGTSEDKASPLRGERANAVHYHTQHDPHRQASGLADIILGGQDGLVNVLGVILGVAAATGDTRIVLVAGLAAAFAESVSMGAVAFTSHKAESDFYESEREREYRHIDQVPELERQEVYRIYQDKGFDSELLDRIVDTITANQDVWVAVMMAEEHQLTPVIREEALRVALVVGFSAIIGSLIPLLPFVFLSVKLSMLIAVLLAALTLFAVGVYKARMTVGSPSKSGLEMAVIGTVSALAGYGVGVLFQVPPS
jgi:VIT1/CCC1 family predicted Fe2+/Mn2+ transporter